jgi:hypothetical protein
MAEILADCPRCGAGKVTFDVRGSNSLPKRPGSDWQERYEAFAVCRHCLRSTIFFLTLKDYGAKGIFVHDGLTKHGGSLGHLFDVGGHLSLKDEVGIRPPDHLPPEVEAAFREGASCLAIKCFNAAGTMFRLCVDFATQELLPLEGAAGAPNAKQRRDLGLRLQWLFDAKRLPEELHELAKCIKEDGNDGAHRGTLTEADAEDLLDFTVHLLERRYTLPKRVDLANLRRSERKR